MRNKCLTIILLSLAIFASPLGAATKKKTSTPPTPLSAVPSVVLPPEYASRPIIIVDSPEYKELLAKNEFLKAQVSAEQQSQEVFKTNVDQTLIAKEQYINKLEKDIVAAKTKAKKNWVVAVFGWVLGLGFPILAIGAVALCVMNPAILGSIISIFVNIVGFIARLFGRSLEGVANITKRTPNSASP